MLVCKPQRVLGVPPATWRSRINRGISPSMGSLKGKFSCRAEDNAASDQETGV